MSCSCHKPLVGAPTSFTFMPNGQRASSIRIGDTTRITYPYQEQEETWIGNTAEAEVLIAEGGDQDCVRIELANGAFIECTETALLPTQLNGYVAAKDLMGNALAVATRIQLRQTTVRFAWSAVTAVVSMGSLPIMYTYVNERDFWISGNGMQFALMHG